MVAEDAEDVRPGMDELRHRPHLRLAEREVARAALLGQPVTRKTIQAARRALLAEVRPIDDIRSTAEYRRRVAANLIEEFLLEISAEGAPR